MKADLLRLDEVPTASEVQRAAKQGRKELPPRLDQLSRKACSVEEECVLYRTAGWTVFEMDLDIGRRGRETRRQAASSSGPSVQAGGGLGLGMRLETYHSGRFYEPFYLIFARPGQVESKEAGVRDPNGDMAAQTPPNTLRLLRHTIPHFVPLGDILRAYLPPSDAITTTGSGGLQLLDSLLAHDGLTIFLSQLHAHLQSFVSRRQQAIALSQLELPGLVHSALRAFGNDSFGQLSIRWDLPTPTSKDLEASDHRQRDAAHASKTEGKPRIEGEVNTSLEVNIVYHDLSSDNVGQPAKEVSKRQQMIHSLGSPESPGLKCTFATVLVETVRSRVPAARRGSSDKHSKLQTRRIRRTDWEMLFTRVKHARRELIDALREVLDAAWREETQRVLMGRE